MVMVMLSAINLVHLLTLERFLNHRLDIVVMNHTNSINEVWIVMILALNDTAILIVSTEIATAIIILILILTLITIVIKDIEADLPVLTSKKANRYLSWKRTSCCPHPRLLMKSRM